MKTTRTLATLLAVGLFLAVSTAADAATFTAGSAPAVNGADIAQLTGNTDLGGDNAHMWPNRPAHGQSFTTGGDPTGYALHAVTLKRTDGRWTSSCSSRFKFGKSGRACYSIQCTLHAARIDNTNQFYGCRIKHEPVVASVCGYEGHGVNGVRS